MKIDSAHLCDLHQSRAGRTDEVNQVMCTSLACEGCSAFVLMMFSSIRLLRCLEAVAKEPLFQAKVLKGSQSKYGCSKLCHSLVNREEEKKIDDAPVNKPEKALSVDLSEKTVKAHIKDILVKGRRSSAIERNPEISSLTPSGAAPSFNLAAYVNDSPLLQEFVKLGVRLYKWEQQREVVEFILRLDFRKDIAPCIRFLHDRGVPADDLGEYLTKNPLILKESLDDLQVRINYLESKNFSLEMITRIISKNPFWLNFSTEDIDNRLGFFQKTFHLTGDDVRYVATKQPKLITYKMHNIKMNTFVIKEEIGFTDDEIRKLLKYKPKLWMINQVTLKNRFEYAHLEMQLSHKVIRLNPEILLTRLFRTKERHLFLKSLNRAQYNPELEGYVSMKQLVSGTDAEFCMNIAKASVETFNMFLKTL